MRDGGEKGEGGAKKRERRMSSIEFGIKEAGSRIEEVSKKAQ